MIAKKIKEEISGSSLIREMFEKGLRLKAQYGADKVYDFSLGNPDLPAPDEVTELLIKLAKENNHGYMPNAGYPQVRAKLAEFESKRNACKIDPNGVVMTCGAAGAITISLRALLNPGDEVILLTPFFVEYLNYIRHADGKAVIVDCSENNFQPDIAKIAAAITPRTKVILLNSPNNPSGTVYNEAVLRELNELLLSQDHCIYVIGDEPYAEILFDGSVLAPTLGIFPNSLRIYSWAKSISLPGERIGYVAVNAAAEDHDNLCAALAYLNRVLGFVNAPAIWQQLILHMDLEAVTCPINAYEERVNKLCEVLNEAGIVCVKPAGSFYLFPATPIADDQRFIDILSKYNVLAVPGKAFGAPGHMRLSSCVPMSTIVNSLDAFKAAMAELQADKG